MLVGRPGRGSSWTLVQSRLNSVTQSLLWYMTYERVLSPKTSFNSSKISAPLKSLFVKNSTQKGRENSSSFSQQDYNFKQINVKIDMTIKKCRYIQWISVNRGKRTTENPRQQI